MSEDFAIFCAGIGVILLAIIGFQYWHNDHIEGELSTAQAQEKLLESENNAFAKQVQDQNNAIAAHAAAEKAAHDREVAALNLAKDNEAKYITAAQALDSIKPTGNECSDTFAQIDAYYRSAK